ncbi:ZIP family metal transporter [Halonatronum saccharophilum]|uniref:ZIP family metal transporter n=1 Tax=Halonatronum saccharophilum TaxID=150060 RepID=UPI000488D6EC|nr:ZIP family metal transporter [Halonatronum saccharophilum]
MNYVLQTTAIGLLAGVLGTGLGGVTTIFWRRPSERSVSLLLGLAAGVMISIVGIDLFPEALEYGNWPLGLSGTIIGFLVLWLISIIFNRYIKEEGYIQTGILLGLGIALHNFPEGLAIGAGYIATGRLGLSLAVIMALHNYPEGLSMATPMNVGGWSSKKIIIATLLPGIPMGLGAFVGAIIGTISPFVLSLTLGFAAGAMLYITIFELLPGSYSFSYGLDATAGIILGLSLGVLLSVLV